MKNRMNREKPQTDSEKKKRRLCHTGGFLLTVMLAAALTACGGAGGTSDETAGGEASGTAGREEGSELEAEVIRISAEQRDNGNGTATSTTAEYPTADTYDRTLMQGVNGFAYDMSEYLAAAGENYFFSPYSLCSALTLLDNAAGGETKAQMEELLGITDLQNWNMQMSLYMNQAQPEQARISSANSLWFDKQFDVADRAYESYLPLVEFYFDAELYQADFEHDPEGTRDRINQWVLENTGGMIENFKEEVDPDTALSIINAVYFYGEWRYPFLAEYTYEGTFYGISGDSSVDMMHNGELWLPYYESEGIRGLSLPYGDGSKVMNILLPAGETEAAVSDLFGHLSSEEKNRFLENLMNAETSYISTLQIPKYSMDYTVDGLADILQGMGMVDAFDEINAEFPELGNDIFIFDAGHMAKLEVDELGSRAAAATDLEATDNCAPLEENPVDFIVNRPFLFFIQDRETGMILFMGQVNELAQD